MQSTSTSLFFFVKKMEEDGGGSRGRKVVSCAIHGFIELPAYAVGVIDTPEFQRLRSLKQLGVTSLVFPGGTHTRFEHSLGVGHLANIMVRRFRALQPELEVEEHEARLVHVAGLCHDLGHGPFSHRL